MTAVMAEPEPGESFSQLPGVDGAGQTGNECDEDDNGVTEMESLCMNCHDDVRCSARSDSDPMLKNF